MTRRVIKNQPVMLPYFNRGGLSICAGGAKYQAFCPANTAMHSPKVRVGDRLWVRESWRTYKNLDHLPPRQISAGAGIQYEAGGSNVYGYETEKLQGMGKLRPSIFMPRWAVRINLELTGVRVELLNDITEEDAVAEGCINDVVLVHNDHGHIVDYRGLYAKERFQYLWDSINSKTPGKSWDDNPWVWVTSFKVTK